MTLTKIASTGVEDSLRWVLGANGSSDYTFTGPGLTGTVNDPTIYLTRGHTYIFQNNSGGHPFYIKTSIANGGTNDAYNTGVTNNGGGNGTEIVFTVPHDSPDILYYQCSSHASMAGQFNIAGSVADGSITTAKIADDAVTDAKLANSINAAIAANTAKTSNATHTGDVTGSTSLTIANGAVTTAKIADSNVTTAKLQNGAVAHTKIADANVIESKIAANAVTTAKIADQAVTEAKLGATSVTASKIAQNAVSLDKLPLGNNTVDGKFLRANNGADPSFETVNTDLVSDPSPQLGGNLDTNSHEIFLDDSHAVVFGDSNDLRILHDGTDNVITSDGGQSIRLVNHLSGGNESMIKCIPNGATELYHNGSKKFETTVNGLKLSNLPDNSFMLLDQNGRQSALNNYFSSGSTNSRIGVDISTGTTDGAKTRSVDFWPDGMSFNGDTASANRINDYEEGSFDIVAGSGSSVIFTSANNKGSYTKIGRQVTIAGQLRVHSGSGNVRIGLPFNSAPNTNDVDMAFAASVIGYDYNAQNGSDCDGLFILIDADSSYARFMEHRDNNPWTSLDGDPGAYLQFTITYFVP